MNTTAESTYRVRITADGVDCGTYTVEAPREGLAQTRAMMAMFHAADRNEAPATGFKSGAFVEYDVTVI